MASLIQRPDRPTWYIQYYLSGKLKRLSPKLVINAEEASRVRQIFALYLKHRSHLLPVVEELARRNWRTKGWTTKGGKTRGGEPFNKCSLYGLLTNPIYIGKIKHKADLFNGEHEAIVDAKVFADVQGMLQQNGRTGGAGVRNRHGALLKGLLHCKACGKSMVHTFSTKRDKQYRYYTCLQAIKSGRATCPSGALPAAEIERVVVDQIRCIGRDAELRKQVLQEARAKIDAEVLSLNSDRLDLGREMRRRHAELRKLVLSNATGTSPRLAALNES
jgi:site-specific DNA recombinase